VSEVLELTKTFAESRTGLQRRSPVKVRHDEQAGAYVDVRAHFECVFDLSRPSGGYIMDGYVDGHGGPSYHAARELGQVPESSRSKIRTSRVVLP